jgi:ribosomal-protein-alanine N-acetyltransferase
MNDSTTTEEEFFDFKCPCCGRKVSFPVSARGSMQECVDCSEPIIVPETGGEGRRIPLPIVTPNLILRKFRGADWKDLVELFSAAEVFEGAPLSLDGEEQVVLWLEQDSAVKPTTPGVPFTLAVEAEESGKVIGFVSLTFSDAERLQVILYVGLNQEFGHRGFGSEAARGALEFCFNGIGLHRAQGFCDSTNIAACHLFEKAGMRREGEFISDHRHGEQWSNTAAYAILRDEFKPGAPG